MVMSSVEGASVVGITVVSMTVVGANVVGLAVVTASVVGDIVLDTVSLDISQLTPEKPVKRPCMTQAHAQHFMLVNSARCPTTDYQQLEPFLQSRVPLQVYASNLYEVQ